MKKILLLALAAMVHGMGQCSLQAQTLKIKGQSQADSAYKDALRIELPSNQVTEIGSKKFLLETGNGNWLANPNFQSSTLFEGWTLDSSGAVLENNFSTAPKFNGTKAVYQRLENMSSFAEAKLISQSITSDNKLSGSKVVGKIRIYSASFPEISASVCIAKDSVEQQCVPVLENTTWFQEYSVSTLGGTTGTVYEIYVKASSSGATAGPPYLTYAAAYLGVEENPIINAPIQEYTASVSNTGVVSQVTPPGSNWISNATVTDTSLFTYTVNGFSNPPNCDVTLVNNDLTANWTGKISGSPTTTSVAVRTGWGTSSVNFNKSASAHTIKCTPTGSDNQKAVVAVNDLDYPPRPYTPTVTHNSGSMTNYTLTSSYAKSGSRVIIEGTFSYTGSTSAFNGINLSLPPGLNFASSVAARSPVGFVRWIGASTYTGSIIVDTVSKTIQIVPLALATFSGTQGIQYGSVSSTFPITPASGNTIVFNAEFEVSEFQPAQGVMVSGLDTIQAKYYLSSAQSIPNTTETVVNFSNKEYDNRNAVTTGASWKFTAPEKRLCSIKALITIDNAGAANSIIVRIRKNGGDETYQITPITTLAIGWPTLTSTDLILNPGDEINVVVYHNLGAAKNLIGARNRNYISILCPGGFKE